MYNLYNLSVFNLCKNLCKNPAKTVYILGIWEIYFFHKKIYNPFKKYLSWNDLVSSNQKSPRRNCSLQKLLKGSPGAIHGSGGWSGGGELFPGITSYCWWQPEIRGSTHQLRLVIPWFARVFVYIQKVVVSDFLPSTVPYLSEAGSTVSTTILPTNRDQRSSGPGRATLLALFPWLVGKLFQL